MYVANILAAGLTLLGAGAQAQSVVAHFIAGNAQAASYDFKKDAQLAQSLGIEAFAFNVVQENFNSQLVQKAYDEIGDSGVDFKIFLQFDFAQSQWDMSQVKQHIEEFSDHAAQYKVDGKALVSTFEGGDRAAEWDSVIDSSKMLFVPDWSSSKGNKDVFQSQAVGGVLSWDVWPEGTNPDVSEDIDRTWIDIIGQDKMYVMGVSPWFYTNLAQYGKNWLARGSGLWHSRWESVMNIKPPMVEIITWNDFGESHYIGPNNCEECMPGHDKQVPENSAAYVKNNPHDGWAALLPAYIDAYKSGNSSSTQLDEKLVYAHTTNPVKPAGGCKSDGSKGMHGEGAGGDTVAQDVIDVYVVLNSPAEVKVSVGDKDLTPTALQASLRGVNYFAVPLDGATGEVKYTVTREGNGILSGIEQPGISTDCSEYGGMINYNAITGVITAGGK